MAEEFERIVREFQDKIFRLAFSMLGDRAAAEETAQEVLLRVWKGLPGFRAESSLSTWIYSITRNACLTARGRGGIHAVSLEEPSARLEAERRVAAAWPTAPGAAPIELNGTTSAYDGSHYSALGRTVTLQLTKDF